MEFIFDLNPIMYISFISKAYTISSYFKTDFDINQIMYMSFISKAYKRIYQSHFEVGIFSHALCWPKCFPYVVIPNTKENGLLITYCDVKIVNTIFKETFQSL